MRKLLYCFIVILLIFGGYIISTRFLSAPNVLSVYEKEQAMERILDRELVTTEKGPQTWQTYQGTYLSFIYPADCKVQTKKALASVFESFNCSLQNPRRNLTVQVVSGTSLTDSPAVVLRQNDTNTYKKEESAINGYDAVVFMKDASDGAEKAGFFIQQGRIYSLVATGSQIDSVKKLYEAVIQTIEVK